MNGTIDQQSKQQEEQRIRQEWLKCRRSLVYFVDRYVYIYNATDETWLPFHLWPAQKELLGLVRDSPKTLVLKARQLGVTWLALAYILWRMLFRSPSSTILLSLREVEAGELLNRVKGMYARLPPFLQARSIIKSNESEFAISLGSRAMAFPTGGGRSYTGSIALVDEADFVDDLNDVLNAVKPTVEAGGQLILVSTSDKAHPQSTFKLLFRAAMSSGRSPEKFVDALVRGTGGLGDYTAVFLPWWARPGRSQEWYDLQQAEMFRQEMSDDSLHAEYPASVEEALAPRSLDKRFPQGWLGGCLDLLDGLVVSLSHAAHLLLYEPRRPDGLYVMGVDPAEGLPNSDDSVVTVLDQDTWNEVAVWKGKIAPGALAMGIDDISEFFNGAPVMVERNNHGGTVILALRTSGRVKLLSGTLREPYDSKRPTMTQVGWQQNIKSKALLCDIGADVFRDKLTRIRTRETYLQLAGMEIETLAAPVGEHDDCAISFLLALAAMRFGVVKGEEAVHVPPVDPIELMDRGAYVEPYDPILLMDRGGYIDA